MASAASTRPPVSLTPRRDVTAIFERYARGRDPADRDLLLERFLPLARSLARKYPAAGEEEDITQVAMVALLKAIDRYDPGRGIAFTSFATPTIVGEIKRYFRDFGWTVRVPRPLQELALRIDRASEELGARLGRPPTVTEIADHCGTDVEHVLEARATATAHRADSLDLPVRDDDPASSRAISHVDDGYARAERRADIDDLLAVLPQREQTILRLRFYEDLTQREIAARVGLSQMQVSRSIQASITQLRRVDVAPL